MHNFGRKRPLWLPLLFKNKKVTIKSYLLSQPPLVVSRDWAGRPVPEDVDDFVHGAHILLRRLARTTSKPVFDNFISINIQNQASQRDRVKLGFYPGADVRTVYMSQKVRTLSGGLLKGRIKLGPKSTIPNSQYSLFSIPDMIVQLDKKGHIFDIAWLQLAFRLGICKSAFVKRWAGMSHAQHVGICNCIPRHRWHLGGELITDLFTRNNLFSWLYQDVAFSYSEVWHGCH